MLLIVLLAACGKNDKDADDIKGSDAQSSDGSPTRINKPLEKTDGLNKSDENGKQSDDVGESSEAAESIIRDIDESGESDESVIRDVDDSGE